MDYKKYDCGLEVYTEKGQVVRLCRNGYTWDYEGKDLTHVIRPDGSACWFGWEGVKPIYFRDATKEVNIIYDKNGKYLGEEPVQQGAS